MFKEGDVVINKLTGKKSLVIWVDPWDPSTIAVQDNKGKVTELKVDDCDSHVPWYKKIFKPKQITKVVDRRKQLLEDQISVLEHKLKFTKKASSRRVITNDLKMMKKALAEYEAR